MLCYRQDGQEGKKMFTIYDCHLNGRTMNFGGLEWVVDGERGRRNYPGTWPACLAKMCYQEGLSYDKVKPGFCDGCQGQTRNEYCWKQKGGSRA